MDTGSRTATSGPPRVVRSPQVPFRDLAAAAARVTGSATGAGTSDPSGLTALTRLMVTNPVAFAQLRVLLQRSLPPPQDDLIEMPPLPQTTAGVNRPRPNTTTEPDQIVSPSVEEPA